ncbi:disease resistance protein BAK6-like [Cryptomeria japonica]|nr:disease resistance protein BAK6-like [Cryptomeria japonica]XP_059071913.1 disease resistance protein BAK6-like [Cryptomeria japonica]
MLLLPSSFSTLVQPSAPPDQLSLLTVKATITSDPNNALANWNTTIPMCNWTGVLCSPNSQQVVMLDFTAKGLQGVISLALGNLTALVQLYLNYNQLHGSIPDELGKLTGLKFLLCLDNYFTGIILPSLKNLSTLLHLDLSSNNLHGPIPPEIGMLTQLRWLYLYANQLSGSIPSSIGNLSNLVVLQLLANNLTGSIPHEIGNLTQLRTSSSMKISCQEQSFFRNHSFGIGDADQFAKTSPMEK